MCLLRQFTATKVVIMFQVFPSKLHVWTCDLCIRTQKLAISHRIPRPCHQLVPGWAQKWWICVPEQKLVIQLHPERKDVRKIVADQFFWQMVRHLEWSTACRQATLSLWDSSGNASKSYGARQLGRDWQLSGLRLPVRQFGIQVMRTPLHDIGFRSDIFQGNLASTFSEVTIQSCTKSFW